ncbi:MAG: hypothetical protein RR199_00800 [Alistipes sp.]
MKKIIALTVLLLSVATAAHAISSSVKYSNGLYLVYFSKSESSPCRIWYDVRTYDNEWQRGLSCELSSGSGSEWSGFRSNKNVDVYIQRVEWLSSSSESLSYSEPSPGSALGEGIANAFQAGTQIHAGSEYMYFGAGAGYGNTFGAGVKLFGRFGEAVCTIGVSLAGGYVFARPIYEKGSFAYDVGLQLYFDNCYLNVSFSHSLYKDFYEDNYHRVGNGLVASFGYNLFIVDTGGCRLGLNADLGVKMCMEKWANKEKVQFAWSALFFVAF